MTEDDGTVVAKRIDPDSEQAVRFWQQVRRDVSGSDCWLWTGRRNRDGYGVVHLNGRGYIAHRLAYELACGAVPEKMLVSRSCDERLCVRPEHLTLLTHRQIGSIMRTRPARREAASTGATAAGRLPDEVAALAARGDGGSELALDGRQAAAGERLERYREFFEFAPDAFVITDLRGVILEANHAISALVGFPRRYCAGKPLATYVVPDDRPVFDARLAQFRRGGDGRVREFEIRFRGRGEGGQVVISARACAVQGERGGPDHIRWLLHDITERRRVEDELRRLGAELERRVRERTVELEAITRLKDALLVSEQIAHAGIETRHRRFVECAIAGIFQVAPSGRLLLANAALARMLGYPSVDDLLRMVPDARRLIRGAHGRELFRRLREHGSAIGLETRLRRGDGAEIAVVLNAWLVHGVSGRLLSVEGLVAPAGGSAVDSLAQR